MLLKIKLFGINVDVRKKRKTQTRKENLLLGCLFTRNMANSITKEKVSQLLTLAIACFTSMITRHCLNSKQQEGKPIVNTLIFT